MGSQYLILKDQRILSYKEYGALNGFPVIYYHGSQSSRFEMHHNMHFADEHALRVIAIDRPGHGDSCFNPLGSLLSFADDVAQLLSALGITKCSVLGMSAGAPFAMAFAYKYPESVHKLGLVSGFGPLSKVNTGRLSREVRLMLGIAKTFPWLLRLMLVLQRRRMDKQSGEALKDYLSIMSFPDQEILQDRPVLDVINKTFREAFKKGSKGVAYELSKILVRDWGFDLGKIPANTLIWHGYEDNNVPVNWSMYFRAFIPNSDLKIIKNEGHLILFKYASNIFLDLKDDHVAYAINERKSAKSVSE